MSSIFEYLKKMLSDSREVSLVRVLTLFVVLDVIFVWNINCIKTATMQDIPWGAVSIVAIMITGKAAQRFSEGQEREHHDDLENRENCASDKPPSDLKDLAKEKE